MLYCPKCNVDIRGDKICCPLCQGRLTGAAGNAAFPILKERKYSLKLMVKICIFLLVVLEVVMMTIQIITGFQYQTPNVIMMWALFVAVDLCVAMYFRGNIIKLGSLQGYAIIILCLILDWHDRRMSWSFNWAIPITLVCLAIITIFVGYAAGLRMVDYMIYLVIDVLLALLQIIPVVLKLNTIPHAAIISMGIMIIVAAFVFIFRSRELRNAVTKYMNI